MAKSKHRKNHKQKVKNRNLRISDEKSKAQKFQKEYIMDLIKKEQESGMFDETKPVDSVGPIIDGPSI